MTDRRTSMQLARFFVRLEETRAAILDGLLPLAGFVGVEDADLIDALETAAKRADEHLASWRLVAERKPAAR